MKPTYFRIKFLKVCVCYKNYRAFTLDYHIRLHITASEHTKPPLTFFQWHFLQYLPVFSEK